MRGAVGFTTIMRSAVFLLPMILGTPGLAWGQSGAPLPPSAPPPPSAEASAPEDYPFGESKEPLEELTRWLGEQTDSSGRRCALYNIVPTPDGTFVACGAAGLWVVRFEETGKPKLVETRGLSGDVVGLFREDGRIWVKVSRLEAYPVDETPVVGPKPAAAPLPAPAAPASPPPPAPLPPPQAAPPPPPQYEGRVVEVLPGEVVVSLGTEHGLDVGQRVELSEESAEVVGGGERSRRRSPLAVGVVNSVSPRFSRVKLGLNERVPLGATARSTVGPPTRSATAPPRAGGIWEVDVMLRPFLALERLGGGFLASTALGYRFESNLHLEARVDPFGLGDAEGEDSAAPLTALLLFAYDQHLFEIGLGLGGQTVNAVPFGGDPGSGTLVSQVLRLGAEDGLHLDLRSDIVLFHSRFSFSGLTGEGQIPVGTASWLLFRGAGGNAGYGYGELGLRVLLRGNGDEGSTFLTVAAGGAVVFKSQSCRELPSGFSCDGNDTSASGPMAGVGATWRF
jgi:hypothetical protein